MKVKRYIAALLLLLASLPLSAQKLTVDGMLATNDLSASQYRRKNLAGEACALVKVQLATTGATFEGNVIQPVEYKSGEYWVYMSNGSRELRIKHPSFVPLHVTFSDYGVKGVQSLTTYDLTLLFPQGVATVQTQKLIINYQPTNATVLVDSELQQGKGRVEVVLPLGEHTYTIAANGYITAEGMVKLNGGSQRVITEQLEKKVSAQPVQPAVTVQQPIQTTSSSAANSQASASQTVSSSGSGNSSSGKSIETITVKGVSFNMVRVEGGTFQMGATSEQGSDADSDEKPVHQVTLSTYYIGETEVTQELWEVVMDSNPSKYKGAKKPVEQVSWDDCQEFTQKLKQLTGRTFRLPTEAEWEFAARGGNKSRGYKYSGSNNINDVALYGDHSSESTYDVGLKNPNELGLYDMSGNVEEWCQDGGREYDSERQNNPMGPLSDDAGRKLRGGGYGSLIASYRVSNRNGAHQSGKFPFVGFRLAL